MAQTVAIAAAAGAAVAVAATTAVGSSGSGKSLSRIVWASEQYWPEENAAIAVKTHTHK